MENDKYERYRLFLPDPVIQDEYIREVLHLYPDSVILSKKINDIRKTDTGRIIKLAITWKTADIEFYRKFFMKTSVFGWLKNGFNRFSIQEVRFYQQSVDAMTFTIKCHDAYISGNKYLLLLDDVSDDYYTAGEINVDNINYWYSAAESLALMHSYYWNGANAGCLVNIRNTDETQNKKARDLENELNTFIPHVENFCDQAIINIYKQALYDAEEYERVLAARRTAMTDVSVIHGDSHIFNFMFPKKPSADKSNPLLIDFQFWKIGVGVADIMNLTRAAFPYMDKPEYHLGILRRYHDTLIKNGVKYSWERCLLDYRLSVSHSVFDPVYHYAEYGLGHNHWKQGVIDSAAIYQTVRNIV